DRTINLEIGNDDEERVESTDETNLEEPEEEEEEKETEEEILMDIEPVAEDESVEENTELIHAVGDYDPTLDLSGYQYPTLELLESYGDKKIEVNKEELEANKNKIVETLSHYNISIDKIKATIGPTVTLF